MSYGTWALIAVMNLIIVLSKYDEIPNITFTPDKELNILIYRSPSYLIIYTSHTLLNTINERTHASVFVVSF